VVGVAVQHGRVMKEKLTTLLKQNQSLVQLLEERDREVEVLTSPIEAAKIGMKDTSEISEGHTYKMKWLSDTTKWSTMVNALTDAKDKFNSSRKKGDEKFKQLQEE